MVDTVEGEAVGNHEFEIIHQVIHRRVLIMLEFVLHRGEIHRLFNDGRIVWNVQRNIIDRLGEPESRFNLLGVLHLLDQECLLVLSNRAGTDLRSVLRSNEIDIAVHFGGQRSRNRFWRG